MKCTGLVFRDPDNIIVLVRPALETGELYFEEIEDTKGIYIDFPLSMVDIVEIEYEQEDVYTLTKKFKVAIQKNGDPISVTEYVTSEPEKFNELISRIYLKAVEYMGEHKKRAFNSQDFHI